MKILDDMSNKKIDISTAIWLLQKAQKEGDTVLKLKYEIIGTDQAVIIETEKNNLCQ